MSESIDPKPISPEERLRQIEEQVFESAAGSSLTPEEQQALRDEYNMLLLENLERKHP